MRNLILAITLTGLCFAQTNTERLNALKQETAKLYREGKYAEALPVAQAAVELAQKTVGADHPETATSLNNLALLYESQGQYAKAEPLFLRAQAILEKALGADHPDTASSLNNLATLYRSQGQYGKAEPLYVRALAIYEKALGADHPSTSTSLNNLASLYESQGQYAKAEPLYVRALAIKEKALGADHPSTATSLNNLASLYRSQGQYAKAEPLYLRALQIREKALGANHPDTATSLNNLAGLYRSQEQDAKAEPLYVRALAICEKALGADHPDIATSLNNLAELYRSQGQYAKAEPLYVRALAICEKALGADHPDTATLLNNLGELYLSQGQYAKAEPLYVRALAICEKALGADHPGTAISLNNLAGLYRSQGQYAKAEPLYLRALAICEKALGADHPDTAKMRTNLTVHYLDRGAADQAQRVLEEGWPEQLKYLERSLTYADETWRRKALADLTTQLSILLVVQRDAPALRRLGLKSVLTSKGRVFEDTITALMALRPRLQTELQAKLDELIVIRREEAGLVAQRNPVERARMKDLNVEDDKLSEDLVQRSPDFRALTHSPNVTDLSAQLGSAALAELVIYDEFYAPKRDGKQWGPSRYGTYLLTSDGKVGWLDLGPVSEIDRYVRRYRQAMRQPDNQAVATAAAREIDRLALEPIRKSLPGVKEFYVAADGLLRLIPLAAMRDAAGVNVIENFKIHTLLTGRDLLRGAPLHSAQPPWVGGLEEFGKRGGEMYFRPLPGAAAEALEVAKIMKPKPQLLSPEQMTKSFLMDKMNGPRILHLATHGYYRGAEGGLALRDANVSEANILTHSDAAKLKLFGTQLAVLSACETGLGEVSFADGITGLQRSLTLAGARSQILTLWPVSDGKTKELMVSFYRNLFEKGMTKSEALRQAQLEMSRQGVDAYYWAPFVLYGDGGPLGQ